MEPEKADAKMIFGEALGLSVPAERAAYLDRACAGNAALRQEVESLLSAYEKAGDFLDQTVALPEPDFALEAPGTRIGHYKLLEKIGEGGFGVVWMAEQEEPVRRRVALKIIKLGMDTREVVARFEAERQALAMMDHPNIATVFDGGATQTGRPYFVMELVKGVPITEYCDVNRLSTEERLQLFMQVCHAVQHAHQKGVIHRDLKSSNVLVTVRDDRPVPKVIDFGVAKATQARLTEKTLFTRFHQRLGTPAYMSPEQAGLGSLDVDTRSDIYSLGVLLYELLTGRTPFETGKLLAASYEAVMRTIREEEPPKPSTRLSTLSREELSAVAAKRGADPAKLSRLIHGDLDWIVMKALEKDRTRRYETANGLATDLERHLQNEPVVARPPTAAYQLMKFARRHRAELVVGSAILGLLLASVVGSTWLAVRAIRAEDGLSASLQQKEQALHEAERQQRQARESEDRALSLIYAIDMRDAQQAIANALLGQARALLDTHLPRSDHRDRRGFEWYYYAHLAKGQHTAVLLEQSNSFTKMAAAQDGKMLALLDLQEIKAFDLSQRKVVQRWPRTHRYVYRISISPDGQWIALGTTNDLVLLNTATGQRKVLAAGRADVISFAPDRPWIAVSSLLPPREDRLESGEGRVRIWDYEQGRLLRSLSDANGPLLWWETNSTVLAGVNCVGALQRWDAGTGTRLQLFMPPSPQETAHYAGAIAAQRFRGALDSQLGYIRVFDPVDGRILSESPWSKLLTPTTGLALSADGRFVASSELASIRFADTDHLQDCERLVGHLGEVRGVAFIGTSSNLVSCGEDGRLLLWERRRPLAIPFPEADGMRWFLDDTLVLSADERFCAAKGKLWSLPGGGPVRSYTGVLLGFSPTGGEYATESAGELQVWKFAASGTNPSRIFPALRLPSGLPGVLTRLSVDGRFLAYNDCCTNILVVEARKGYLLGAMSDFPLPARFKEQEVLGVEFLPTSHHLLVQTSNGGLIWDWQTPTNSPMILLPGEPYGVSWDGLWIGLRDESGRRLKLVEAAASQKVRVLLEGHTHQVLGVAFSHDGKTLASVDMGDELRLWNLPEGRLVGVMKVSAGSLRKLAFSPNDQRLYILGELGVEVLGAPRSSQTVNQPPFAEQRVFAVPPDSIWAR